MKKGAGVHVRLLFGATCLVLSGAGSSLQPRMTSNACYSSGGDCGFHSLTCDGGLVIAVDDTHYGFKDQAAYRNHSCQKLLADCRAYVSREACCGYDVKEDCLKPYSREHRQRVKENCDGEVMCRVRATDVTGSCSRPPHVYSDVSSYSVISYVCVSAAASQTTSSSSMAASQPAECGPGCRSTTTSTTVSEDMTAPENDGTQQENDERVEQLIIGVSVGLGAGFIFLVLILIACWIRIRRKPQDSMSVRSGPSAMSSSQARNTLPRRPSKAYTLTSTMPSSHYSSFLYSDTLPSSYHGSVYPAESSIYSVPADVCSAASSIGPASLLRAGYSNGDVPAPDGYSSGQLVFIRPQAEFAQRSPPLPPAGSSDGSLPPKLPARPSILKPITPKESYVNGGFVGSSVQLSEKRSGSETSSSRITARRSSSRVEGPRYGQSPETFTKTGSSVSTAEGSSGRESGGGTPPGTHGEISFHPPGLSHHPEASRRHSRGSTSSCKEWWNLRDSVQSGGHAGEASPPVLVLLEEGGVGALPDSHQSQDRHEAVETWLGKVKPQVPF